MCKLTKKRSKRAEKNLHQQVKLCPLRTDVLIAEPQQDTPLTSTTLEYIF